MGSLSSLATTKINLPKSWGLTFHVGSVCAFVFSSSVSPNYWSWALRPLSRFCFYSVFLLLCYQFTFSFHHGADSGSSSGHSAMAQGVVPTSKELLTWKGTDKGWVLWLFAFLCFSLLQQVRNWVALKEDRLAYISVRGVHRAAYGDLLLVGMVPRQPRTMHGMKLGGVLLVLLVCKGTSIQFRACSLIPLSKS